MKPTSATLILIFVIILFGALNLSAQQQDTTALIHAVVKHDGTEFIGRLISQDAREVLIDTKAVGQVIIPKHEIKEIREIKATEFTPTGTYIPDDIFATRYFITTNGLPIKKGESYILWNLYGPDLQFGVGKNFGVGIMTTWMAAPIIGSAKYSIKLAPKTNLGIGTLLGTGSWGMRGFSMALPFAALTFGDRKANISFSGGYGAVTYPQQEYNPSTQGSREKKVSDSRALLSVAFMFKVGKRVSFVFDSFIIPGGGQETKTGVNYHFNEITGQTTTSTYQYQADKKSFALFIPGIRYQVESNRAFQFGFAGLSANGETLPVPIPMIQFFRKL